MTTILWILFYLATWYATGLVFVLFGSYLSGGDDDDAFTIALLGPVLGGLLLLYAVRKLLCIVLDGYLLFNGWLARQGRKHHGGRFFR